MGKMETSHTVEKYSVAVEYKVEGENCWQRCGGFNSLEEAEEKAKRLRTEKWPSEYKFRVVKLKRSKGKQQ